MFQDLPHDSHEELAREHLDSVRGRIADAFLVAYGLVSIPSLLLSLSRVFSVGFLPVMAMHGALAGIVVCAALARGRLSFALKGLIVASVPWLIAVAGFLSMGLLSTAPGLVVSAAITLLLFGKRAAYWLAAASVVFVALIGALVVYGGHVFAVDPLAFVRSPAAWAAVLTALVLGTLALIYALSVFTAEQTRLIEMLQDMRRMESLGHLAGGLAHDFRNLLGIVIGNLDETIEQTPEGSVARTRAQAALDAALRGSRLVDSLMSYSRQQRLAPEITDPNLRVASMVELMRGTLGRSIRIEFAPQPGLRSILVDIAQFDSALLNLGSNARDAMAAGGTLRIALRNLGSEEAVAMGARVPDHRPGFVLMEVADEGEGMPPEIQARIFDPFFSTKAPGHGTGLGLSMVHGFVRQSGGDIVVESAPGKGTTMRVFWPAAAAA